MPFEWTCTATGASTTDCVVTATTTISILNGSSSPIYVQDSGNVSFALTILIVLGFLMVVGFLFNNMTSHKPWLR